MSLSIDDINRLETENKHFKKMWKDTQKQLDLAGNLVVEMTEKKDILKHENEYLKQLLGEKRKPKKIAILGKLETKYDAPFDDKSWEIWSMNKHKDEELIPRVDKWFDIHINPDKKDADVLREDFPFDECKQLAGGNYFVTITSYLIAYAILKGATHIALYGMRFTIDHERRQRELENVRQWIFFALGRGIEVSIPSDKEYLLPEHIIKEGEDYDQ